MFTKKYSRKNNKVHPIETLIISPYMYYNLQTYQKNALRKLKEKYQFIVNPDLSKITPNALNIINQYDRDYPTDDWRSTLDPTEEWNWFRTNSWVRGKSRRNTKRRKAKKRRK